MMMTFCHGSFSVFVTHISIKFNLYTFKPDYMIHTNIRKFVTRTDIIYTVVWDLSNWVGENRISTNNECKFLWHSTSRVLSSLVQTSNRSLYTGNTVNTDQICAEPRHCHLHCCRPIEQNEWMCWMFVCGCGCTLFGIAAKVTTSQHLELHMKWAAALV